MSTTLLDDYPVTNYAAGDETTRGKRLTVLESKVTSHPDHTSTIGANRIKKGDPVAVGSEIGIALNTTTAATDKVTILTEGEFAVNVVCNGGTALTDGGPVFIHATAGTLHSTYAAGMTLFGTARGASNDASALIRVRLAPPSIYSPNSLRTAVIPMAGGAQNAMSFAWQNPEAVPILIMNAVAMVSAVGVTASAVLDVGPAANATATSDTLFDGLDIVTAIGNFSASVMGGTHGLGCAYLDANGGTNDYLTGKILAAAAAAFAGNMVIQYLPMGA